MLRILFGNAKIEGSDEHKPGLILDYGSEGSVVGLEVLDASKRMEDPKSLDYTVTG